MPKKSLLNRDTSIMDDENLFMDDEEEEEFLIVNSPERDDDFIPTAADEDDILEPENNEKITKRPRRRSSRRKSAAPADTEEMIELDDELAALQEMDDTTTAAAEEVEEVADDDDGDAPIKSRLRKRRRRGFVPPRPADATDEPASPAADTHRSRRRRTTKLITNPNSLSVPPKRKNKKRKREYASANLFAKRNEIADEERNRRLKKQRQEEQKQREALLKLEEEERQQMANQGASGDAPLVSKRWINLSNSNNKILLPEAAARIAKPHQLKGIRFLWKHVAEENTGAILAHAMGLGKSLQSILFMEMFLQQKLGTHIMISAPNSVLSSWEKEIESWSQRLNLRHLSQTPVHCFNDYTSAQGSKRINLLKTYHEKGGILLISQSIIYQLMGKTNSQKEETIKKLEKRYNKNKDVLDPVFRTPGPDLLIVDEVSSLKNDENLFYAAVSEMDTKRRILLTGTPLQNNLKEVFSLVNFVRPGFWDQEEFRDIFIEPIRNGSLKDSTEPEVRMMKWRSFILVTQMRGIAHRENQRVLVEALPEKKEFVIMVKTTELQRKLITGLLDYLKAEDQNIVLDRTGQERVRDFGGLLKCVAILHKIINSPDLLRRYMLEHKIAYTNPLDAVGAKPEDEEQLQEEQDDDDDIVFVENPEQQQEDDDMALLSMDLEDYSSSMQKRKEEKKEQEKKPSVVTVGGAAKKEESAVDEKKKKSKRDDEVKDYFAEGQRLYMDLDHEQDYHWARDILPASYPIACFENNTKMQILYSILAKSLKEDRKVLIFSQFTSTLDVIETFFSKYPINGDILRPDLTYLRLDGKTPTKKRKQLIDWFNDEDFHSKIFLLSTKAGGIGLNLQAASVLVLMDITWNPTNDQQALCRSFRFGQTKDVHIYRLVAAGTAEDSIYKKSLNKVWLSRRVVEDEICKRFLEYEQVFKFKYSDTKEIDQDRIVDTSYQNDFILKDVYKEKKDLIQAIYAFESLYVRDPEGGNLSAEELQESIQDFEEARENARLVREYTRDQQPRRLADEMTHNLFRTQFMRVLSVVTRDELIPVIQDMWNTTAEDAAEAIDKLEREMEIEQATQGGGDAGEEQQFTQTTLPSLTASTQGTANSQFPVSQRNGSGSSGGGYDGMIDLT